jgi:hypothetical protein
MKATLNLTAEQADALVYVLGNLLDGYGNYDGTLLYTLEPIYEALTDAEVYKAQLKKENK